MYKKLYRHAYFLVCLFIGEGNLLLQGGPPEIGIDVVTCQCNLILKTKCDPHTYTHTHVATTNVLLSVDRVIFGNLRCNQNQLYE